MEIVQEKFKKIPEYEVIKQEGPDHDIKFTMVLKINNKIICEGRGSSRKDAKNDAAKNALYNRFANEFNKKKEKILLEMITWDAKKNDRMPEWRHKQLIEFLNRFNIKSRDAIVLNRAFTHSSWCNDLKYSQMESNKYYSDLGSNIWNLYIYKKMFDERIKFSKSDISSFNEHLDNLKDYVFENFNIKDFLMLGQGQKNEGITRDIKKEAVNAFLWALFIYIGIEKLEIILDKILFKYILDIINTKKGIEAPTSGIIKMFIKDGKEPPTYNILSFRGPTNKRVFTVGSFSGNKECSRGEGSSILEAKKKAAINAINNYNNIVSLINSSEVE